jgi:glutamyl-tRNA reductase
MDLHQVGVDAHVAPLEVRERLAVPLERAGALARVVKEAVGASEVLVLSTCNRTEVLVAASAPDAAERTLRALLAAVPGAPAPDLGCYAQRSGEAAARHVFRLAAGLESAILGETEIQGQLRDAHAACAAAGAAGPLLDRLVRGAVHAGKRARSETGISSGGLSHGGAAAQVARRVFGRLSEREVLVVGAGHVATQTARALADLGGGRFAIANRTAARAEELAATLPNATVVDPSEIGARLATAHVVVLAADAAPLTAAETQRAIARRRDPLLVLDLCVPRQAEPAVGDLPGVFLYDLESLEALVATALAARREAVPRVEAIVDEEFARFRDWMRGHGALPAIRSLNEWAEEVRRAEMAALAPDLSPEARAAVEALTKRLVQRLLGRPAARVVEGARAADPRLPTAEHLKSLFGLGEEPRG